jgi:hypothetical protein
MAGTLEYLTVCRAPISRMAPGRQQGAVVGIASGNILDRSGLCYAHPRPEPRIPPGETPMKRLNALLKDASDSYPNSDAICDRDMYPFRNQDSASRSLHCKR